MYLVECRESFVSRYLLRILDQMRHISRDLDANNVFFIYFKCKEGFEFRHSIRNASRDRLKMGNGSVLMGMECLRFSGCLCLFCPAVCVEYSVKLYKKNKRYKQRRKVFRIVSKTEWTDPRGIRFLGTLEELRVHEQRIYVKNMYNFKY